MMSTSLRQTARDAELLGDEIVGVIQTEEPPRNLDQVRQGEDPKLWRFAHYQENINEVRFIASGEHGVVVLAMIKDLTYALKVVWSLYASCPILLIDCPV